LVWWVVGRSNSNTKESPKNTEHNVKIFERKLALLKFQIQEPQSRHYRFGRYKDASWFLRSVAHTHAGFFTEHKKAPVHQFICLITLAF